MEADDPMPPRVLSLNVPVCSPSPAQAMKSSRRSKAVKQASCVDCGGCLCCCDCNSPDDPEEIEQTLEEHTNGKRAHSIKLGAVEAQMIDDLFSNDPDKRLSSRALTIPMADSMESGLSYDIPSKELVVRKLGEIHEESSESRLFGSQGKPRLQLLNR